MMKLTTRKKIALICLSLIVLITVFLKFIDFDLLPISQKNDEYNRVVFLGTLSILFTILVIVFIEKRIDFFTTFHFMWIFPLILLISKDRKSTRLNSSHVKISYAVFCLKKKI